MSLHEMHLLYWDAIPVTFQWHFNFIEGHSIWIIAVSSFYRREKSNQQWMVKMSSRTSSFNLNTSQHETKKSLEKWLKMRLREKRKEGRHWRKASAERKQFDSERGRLQILCQKISFPTSLWRKDAIPMRIKRRVS